jgi:monoamine oxidase
MACACFSPEKSLTIHFVFCKIARKNIIKQGRFMAKSQLIRSLLWAHRQLHGAEKTGMPVMEYAQMGQALRRKRREFLKNSACAVAGIAGLSALPASAFAAGKPTTLPTVAIIGGGMAGLHCAWQLKKMGCKATIYEAAKRVTGRIVTDRTSFAGQNMFCDLGGEYIDTGHTTMRKIAKHFGLKMYDYAEDDQLIDPYYDFNNQRYTVQQVLEAYAPIAKKIDAANASVDNPNETIMFNNPNGGEHLDAHSVSSWLSSIGASGWIKKLIEVGYETEFGLDTDINNVINMLYLIGTNVKNMKTKGVFEIYGLSDERFHVVGGNDLIPSSLAGDLPGQIELEKQLVALRTRSDGKYVMTFACGAERTADHVVLALPFSILRTVDLSGVSLPSWKTRSINEIGYGQISKVFTGHTRPVWREQGFIGNSLSDKFFQSTTETSRMQPGTTGILENYTAGSNALEVATGTTNQQVTKFHNQVERLFPGLKDTYNGNKVRMAWNLYPHTRAAYSSYLVGQYTTIAGAEPIRIGNLHFCGEHTTMDYQGWMEGAARTGADAAAEVGADLHLCPAQSRITGRRGLLQANG